jgi:hypothetical protein
VWAAAGCGGSGSTKHTIASKPPVNCSAPGVQITAYEGTLLTVPQVRAAFAAQGLRLHPIVRNDPSLGLQVPSLPSGAFVGVALATKCNEGVPTFAYYKALGSTTSKVKRVVVQNVGIEYHVPPQVLRQLQAVVTTLKRKVHSQNHR